MFKKKPQIKNLSPLRSSDRRKLADQIISDYSVQTPTNSTSSNESSDKTASTPPTDTPQAPTITSIRTALLPESTQSARFTTHAGANATLVSGTVYVGAHPDQEERILWIQYGKEQRLYPTVYTLWANPGLVPLLYTQDFVVEKLHTGADLMTPGLVGGPPWPENAKEGKVVAVAGLGKPSVPTWVGWCKIDISALGGVQGLKGAAVEGVHWAGDEIWSWSAIGAGGRAAPDEIPDWLNMNITHQMNDLDLEDEEVQEDGGVSLDQPTAQQTENTNGKHEEDDDNPAEEEDVGPTTAEIDAAFHAAFLYSLHTAQKQHQAPHYGFDFPIQASFLISNMVQPYLKSHSPHYTIKKTSWKNAKKFIKHLDKTMLVKSKDRNGGETVILDIDFDDEQVKSFVPYKLPKPKPTPSSGSNGASDGTLNGTAHGESSIGPKLTLQTLYRPSSKLVPDLLPSKTTYYTSSEVSAFLKKYIENNAATLTQGTSSPRYLKLDPFIANNILSSNSSSSDTKVLAAGEIARDVLLKRILGDDHLLIPHWLLLRGHQSYDPSKPDPSLKPKSGPPPHVTLTTQKQAGNKVVTRIAGLEVFGINPTTLAPELAKKCAGSASVGQLVGGKPGTLEVTVQGDQRDTITLEMDKRGVKKEWIEVVDKTKTKGKGR